MGRLFVGIDFAPETRTKLTAIAVSLRAQCGNGRWVNPDDYHLTLHFLGEVQDSQLPSLSTGLSQGLMSVSQFEITFDRLGWFPPDEPHARVLWIGPTATSEQLQLCRERVVHVCGDLGLLRSDDPTFYPHVTLARFRDSPASTLEAACSGISVAQVNDPLAVPPIVEHVSSIVLYETRKEAVKYKPLQKFRLFPSD